ncbi:MAG: phosphatase PAP2-related protein [bacterium]|nr:phosphatase PAP2-related protein [bacterium]
MQVDFTLRDVFSGDRFPSLIGAFALLGASYVVEHFANIYAFDYSQRPTSNYVGDLVLDNIPVVDLSFIIIEVALISIVLVTLFVLSKPRYLLFTLKAVALFIIIRAIFISLTHVGIHPDNIAPGLGFFDSIYTYLNFQTGLFFSGHTGMPFLVALIFWDNKKVRYILLSLSFIFAVAVLLAHIHYSIDVLAAPFMAYGIFKIAQYLFPRDYELINRAVDNTLTNSK